jgi:hypothetical protein
MMPLSVVLRLVRAGVNRDDAPISPHVSVNRTHRRNKMSDEVKKVEDEAVKAELKAEPSAELSEPALDDVVGGTAASGLTSLRKLTGVTLKRG